jgi:predicted kinase
MAERPELTAPMMGTWASFNANNARRQSREELQHLGAAHTLADHNRAINICAVNLED